MSQTDRAAWPWRWALYLHEMFQPGSRLIFSLLTSIGLSWGVLALQGKQSLGFGPRMIVVTASLFLILLYYRLCDEFKDLDTDKKHFPDRPVPAGQVLEADLRAMQLFATVAGFGLNLLWREALASFALLWLYAWLMGKWFFLPHLIGNNRLLAFVTHGPISLFGSLYVIDAFAGDLVNLPHLLLALWFALPGFAWEVARKTRAPQNEEAGYQIYSSMLGYKGAATLPPLFTLANLGIGWWLGDALALPVWWLPALLVISLAYMSLFAIFWVRPLRFEPWLKPASEAYTALLLIGLPVALAQGKAVLWWSAGF